MADVNPFQQVYEGLWALLNANAGFVSLIPTGNQINYDGTRRNPEKRAIQPADLPEARLLMRPGGKLWEYRTSNGSSVTQLFDVQVSTGEKPLTVLFDVEWEVYRAFADWMSVLEILTWNDEDFVKKCKLLEISSQTLDSEEHNRSQYGWSTVWSGEVEMWFSTESLKP